MKQSCLTLFLSLMIFTPAIRAADAGDMDSLTVGSRAPEWEVQDWMNSGPLSLESLRGQVVLVRWWTGPECPFCSASAPLLNDLYRRYRDKGVVVIGFYHHKSDEPLSVHKVKKLGKKIGMEFPLAVDPEWRTLMKYWTYPDQGEKWTSASFLIDQEGLVCYIHPGGTITNDEGRALEQKIVGLLEQYEKNKRP